MLEIDRELKRLRALGVSPLPQGPHEEPLLSQATRGLLEGKFECGADTVGLDLAAVGTVVRNTQGCSLTKLSFKT